MNDRADSQPAGVLYCQSRTAAAPPLPCLHLIPLGGIIGGMAATAPGYAKDKEQLLQRLRRVEGQVRGIQRMVEDDRYCIDVLTQVNAIKAALDRTALLLLQDHVSHCVTDAIRGGEGAAKVDELTTAIGRYLQG